MAATDVITFERAKQVLQIGVADTRNADIIQALVTAVSHRLDEIAPVVQRSIDETIDTDGTSHVIELSTAPVASITAVTLYQSGTPTTLTAETLTVAGGYLAVPRKHVALASATPLLSRRLRRRSGFSDELWEEGRVRVQYAAGWCANAAAVVGTPFETAAIATLVNFYRVWQTSVAAAGTGEYALPSASFPGFMLPRAALEALTPYRSDLTGVA